MQFDAKARIERALDHALAVQFENARRRKPAHQGLAHLRWIGAAPGREQQRFADRLDGQRHDDLVCDLAGLTRAVVADKRDVLAHELFQQRPDRSKVPGSRRTMMDSVACFAPTSPPDTGASR